MSWLEDMFSGGSSSSSADAQRRGSSDSKYSAPADVQDAEIMEGSEPGAGIVDLKFKTLKTGGFKAWLFFWALGQGKADESNQFTVRETADGMRFFLTGAEDSNTVQEYHGVLDIAYGVEPSPYFRVNRINTREEQPYAGELDILCRLVDALMDLYTDPSTPMEAKLFTFPEDVNEISAAKGKLSALAAKYG